MKVVFRLAVVTLLLVAFVTVVGLSRVDRAISGTIEFVGSIPERVDDFQERWDRAERKAAREREKAIGS